MLKTLNILSLALLISTCNGWWSSGPAWNGLQVKFGLNPFTSFLDLPRTVSEAVAAGWTKDSAAGCDRANSTFNGNRYIKGGNKAAMVLFDKNGFIAGLQAGIPKTQVYPKTQNAKHHVFHEESNMWVITAYFVEPATICTVGRTADRFASEGTGTMLAIQNGPTPSSLMRIPMREDRVLNSTNFKQGKCFYAMGMHYWYNLSSSLPCDDTFPMFPMYNKGKLNAFGWAFNPHYTDSTMWEHPTASIFTNFMNDPPRCLGAAAPVTTLHVYLTSRPRWNNYC